MKTSSWRTFWTVRAGEFKGTMEFRGRSQHGRCNTCEDYAQSLRTAHSMTQKAELSVAWDQHLNATFRDRRVYYSINDASTRFWHMMQGSDSIAGLIDGMDQAKFRCPRLRSKTICRHVIVKQGVLACQAGKTTKFWHIPNSCLSACRRSCQL